MNKKTSHDFDKIDQEEIDNIKDSSNLTNESFSSFPTRHMNDNLVNNAPFNDEIKKC